MLNAIQLFMVHVVYFRVMRHRLPYGIIKYFLYVIANFYKNCTKLVLLVVTHLSVLT